MAGVTNSTVQVTLSSAPVVDYVPSSLSGLSNVGSTGGLLLAEAFNPFPGLKQQWRVKFPEAIAVGLKFRRPDGTTSKIVTPEVVVARQASGGFSIYIPKAYTTDGKEVYYRNITVPYDLGDSRDQQILVLTRRVTELFNSGAFRGAFGLQQQKLSVAFVDPVADLNNLLPIIPPVVQSATFDNPYAIKYQLYKRLSSQQTQAQLAALLSATAEYATFGQVENTAGFVPAGQTQGDVGSITGIELFPVQYLSSVTFIQSLANSLRAAGVDVTNQSYDRAVKDFNANVDNLLNFYDPAKLRLDPKVYRSGNPKLIAAHERQYAVQLARVIESPFENQRCATRRSSRAPMATWIMASETSSSFS